MIEKLTPLQVDERGQIHPRSPFGMCLTKLARESESIVEIGTWRGLGSTLCLHLGMDRESQRMWTVEMNLKEHLEAKAYYEDSRITFLHGTLVLPAEVPPFEYPDPAFEIYYRIEVEINKTVPYVLDKIPPQIDLLLIDGGSWSGDVEFSKLWERSTVIALDDTNPSREVKNVKTRQRLLGLNWIVIEDRLDDRNGWCVFKRP